MCSSLHASSSRAQDAILTRIASADSLDQAFAEVSALRTTAGHDDDIWHLRQHWHRLRPAIQQALRNGTFTFSPPRLRVIHRPDKPKPEVVERWSALDTIVLKAMARVLAPLGAESVPETVTSVQGRGGAKGAVRKVCHHLHYSPRLTRVLRTDVKSYYQSIDLIRLQHILGDLLNEPALLRVLGHAIDRCIDQDAEFTAVTRGISKGSPLSPILGALYLTALDEAMEQLKAKGNPIVYIRYVDDLLVLADTPRNFRKAIQCLNQQLAAFGLTKHPDKTSIGKIDNGFDFLGYHFEGKTGRVTVARPQEEQFVARVHSLYETSTSNRSAPAFRPRFDGAKRPPLAGRTAPRRPRRDDCPRSPSRRTQGRRSQQDHPVETRRAAAFRDRDGRMVTMCCGLRAALPGMGDRGAVSPDPTSGAPRAHDAPREHFPCSGRFGPLWGVRT